MPSFHIQVVGWILLLILLCYYGYERWTCPNSLPAPLSTISVQSTVSNPCPPCPSCPPNVTILVNHTHTVIEHHTVVEMRTARPAVDLTCDLPTLDIAPITLHSEGMPDLRFLWVNGPENRQAMQNWFNDLEKYGIALLRRTLAKRNPDTDVFVDIGSHQGLFMHVAGTLGFQAIGFDMQWLCVRLNRCGSLINGFLRHQVHYVYVSPTADNKSVLADSDTCRGGAQAVDAPTDHSNRMAVYPMHAGKWLRQQGMQIAAVKIDTEGYEPFILETLEPVMDQIDTIIFEISPASWSTFGLTFEQGVERISKMWTTHGFYGVHLVEGGTPMDICNPAEGFVLKDTIRFRKLMEETLAAKRFINVALKRIGMTMC